MFAAKPAGWLVWTQQVSKKEQQHDESAGLASGRSGTVRIVHGESEDPDEVTQLRIPRVALQSLPPPISAETQLTGALQERFEFGRLLGRGGMGEVQQAFDRGLLRQVAVKTYIESSLPDEVRQRFISEARITAQLEHPHILPVYSLERTRG